MDLEHEREDSDWVAENELGWVQLGDKRLTARLVTLARSLAHAPDMPLPQTLPRWGDLKAAYRFFDNSKAVPEHILAGHIDATWSRARAVPIVLAVQDTTYLNWEHHRATQGLGGLSDAGRGIIAIVRWPSRRSACHWGCWRNVIGCAMTPRSARLYRIKSVRLATKKVSNGWKASRLLPYCNYGEFVGRPVDKDIARDTVGYIFVRCGRGFGPTGQRIGAKPNRQSACIDVADRLPAMRNLI